MIVHTAVGIALLFLVLWMLAGVAVRAQSIGYGITCEQVRKLTAIERKYWIWRLGLSQEQINQIRRACRR